MDINLNKPLSLISKFYPSRKFNHRTCGILSIANPNTIYTEPDNIATFCIHLNKK